MFEDIFRDAENYKQQLRDEFDRRVADNPPLPEVGDTVILHAGLLMRGHMWVRLEAKCIAVASNSIQVEMERYGKRETNWVHPAVITDIVKHSNEPA